MPWAAKFLRAASTARAPSQHATTGLAQPSSASTQAAAMSAAGTMVVGAWVTAWVLLSALGVFTAFTLRANLATAPAFILLAGVALGALGSHSRAGAAAAAILFASIAWDGWQIAMRCLDLARAG